MSTPLFDALVNKVRDWSNRDSSVLADTIIKDSIRYATETGYRELRLEGMEELFNFTATTTGNSFPIPEDLIEFLALRRLTENRSPASGTSVFSFKVENTGDTLFSGKDDNSVLLQYSPGAIIVTLNGVFLNPSTDYTATNGVSVALTTGAFKDDELNIVAFNNIIESSSVQTFEYTATQGQTSFSGNDNNNNTLSYKLNRILVTKNGLYLNPSTDFTATNKTSIVLTTGATANDTIKIIAFTETTAFASVSSLVELNTIVYDHKTDYRTFVSDSASKYSNYCWTRQKSNILVHPNFSKGDVFELLYYSKGQTIGTEYAVTPANFTAGNLETSDSVNGTALYFLSSVTSPDPDNNDVASATSGNNYTQAFYFKGKEQPNFLRDNQERLIIYLALSFIFDYLGEDNSAQKYEQKANGLITRLNNQERFKANSGGNIRANFEGPLI